MFDFLRKLIRDRRGNAILIAGAALPVLVGFAGLATDTVQWASWKRELQRAADSAAFAGAYSRNADESVDNAVTTDLKYNNHNQIALLAGYPSIEYPSDTGNYTNAVKVTLAVQQKLTFSSFFLSTPPIIKTSATVAMIDDGEFCVVALEKGTDPGITVGGSATVNMGCGAISNSRSGTQSVGTNGNAYLFGANPVAGVGGLPDTIKGAAELLPYHIPQKDPFAGTPSSVPAGMPCQSMAQNTLTPDGPQGQKHLKGNACYKSFSFTGQDNYVLDPGVYYIDSADFSTNGNTVLTGNGVTIVMTGTSPGSVKLNGNSTLNLTAPTSGQYKNLLFVQAPNAATDNLNVINGNNGSKFDGAFYFPNGKTTFTGSSGAMTKCAMVVSKKVDFSGNTNLQNDTAGCVANQTATGKALKLVG